jgi:tRNA-dihydrouridine synthase 1
MPDESSNLLAYTPMFHSRIFASENKYRIEAFPPAADPPPRRDAVSSTEAKEQLDGNPKFDRPLTVQFCSNDPDILLRAARYVQPYCDAVDLNLGCPQGIAKKGHYGAFLQEDHDLIYRLINTLHNGLDVPVTAKMRVLETREKTLDYAKMILSAGASIITVHGRRRDQKGHNTGLADWSMIRYLRDNLPRDTVIFANGNILQHGDIQRCLAITGADAVMSAEGNLHDPTIFAPVSELGKEPQGYWRDRNGKGGYRLDVVCRRYLDIVYMYALNQDPPERPPLFIPPESLDGRPTLQELVESFAPGRAAGKKDKEARRQLKWERKQRHNELKEMVVESQASISGMQGHLFDLLFPLLQKHTRIRGALATIARGDMAGYENLLSMVEAATREGIVEYESEHGAFDPTKCEAPHESKSSETIVDDPLSSKAAIERVSRPWWICQPHLRPMPNESLISGALMVSKKEKKNVAHFAEETTSGTNSAKRPRLEQARFGDDQLVPA